MNEESDFVLDADEYAICWSQSKGWRLRVPIKQPNDPVEKEALAMAEVFFRLERDHEFLMECVKAWLRRSKS